MSRHLAAFVAFVLGLAACSERPVVVRAVPENSRVRVFYNLTGAFDIPEEHVFWTLDGIIAVEDLPPGATLATPLPLLSVEARRADGCLLANAATSGFDVWLRPVADCGQVAPTPLTAPRVVELPPEQPRDSDGDGFVDAEDLCPDAAAGSSPSPTRRGCPDGDQDGDGVVDAKDRCPSIPAGPLPSASRPGCPAPVDLVIPLGPPSLSGSVMAAGAGGYNASAAYDFAKRSPVDGVVDWPVTLPSEAATASTISVSYDLAASLTWAPTSCFSGFLVAGSGTSSACVGGQVRYGMVVDGVEALGGQGMVAAVDVKKLGNYAATPSSKLSLRLALRGDVVASAVSGRAVVRLSW